MEYLAPGPVDRSLLRLQHNHVSNLAWNGREPTIRLRHPYVWGPMPPEPVRRLIEVAGFGSVLSIGHVTINYDLIMALVERWRPETHTFHFPQGEATVTLQDVSLQLGLPIDGSAVTGTTVADWGKICLNLLGAIPPPDCLKEVSIEITWLESAFQDLPHNASDVVVAQYTRAYIMRMIGRLFMSDTLGSQIHLMYLLLLQDLLTASNYSWGAAVLACLYRGLDHAISPTEQTEIGGCLLLLQSWAWDHIPIIAPRIYEISDDEVQQGLAFPLARRWSCPLHATHITRHSIKSIRLILDRLHIDEFVWMPYNTPKVRRLNIPDVSEVALALVPLICYAIVEWHPIDRVMRQFGMRQGIPQQPPNFDKLHRIDMQEKMEVCWPDYHRLWIDMWEDRRNQIVRADFHSGLLHDNSIYMQWYIRHTRRYISREGACDGGLYSFIHSMRNYTVSPTAVENPTQALNQVIWACTDMLSALEDIYRSPFSTHHEEVGPSQPFIVPDESPSP